MISLKDDDLISFNSPVTNTEIKPRLGVNQIQKSNLLSPFISSEGEVKTRVLSGSPKCPPMASSTPFVAIGGFDEKDEDPFELVERKAHQPADPWEMVEEEAAYKIPTDEKSDTFGLNKGFIEDSKNITPKISTPEIQLETLENELPPWSGDNLSDDSDDDLYEMIKNVSISFSSSPTPIEIKSRPESIVIKKEFDVSPTPSSKDNHTKEILFNNIMEINEKENSNFLSTEPETTKILSNFDMKSTGAIKKLITPQVVINSKPLEEITNSSIGIKTFTPMSRLKQPKSYK